jgi:mannose-6-phosphate isomerase-like protein (cupin superfamily)
MEPSIHRLDTGSEFYTREHCYITETCNFPDDPDVSVARARVEPGVSTRWHRLSGITERYVILSGTGLVEVGELPAEEVSAGDVVVIPPMCAQRISNTGNDDLVFLAICSPRFSDDCYEDIENAQRAATGSAGSASAETVSAAAASRETADTTMTVDIYSTNVDNTFISVPQGTVITSIDFSADFDTGISEVELSRAGLELDPAEPQMELNQADIMAQIEQKGYAIHATQFEANINLSGSSIE